jgi:hypothetical protein
MAHSNEDAENLRQAANLVQQAADAEQLATVSQQAAANAQTDATSKATIANQAKLHALSGARTTPPFTQMPPVAYAPVANHGNGGHSNSNNAIVIAILVVAAAILLCFQFGWMAWLTAGKADNSRVDAVQTKVTTAHTVATTAQATAVEAKALVTTANTNAATAQAAALEAKKDAASAVTVANSANAKADTAISTADSALKKAQAAVNARHTHQGGHVDRRHADQGSAGSGTWQRVPQPGITGNKECKVFGAKGEILADFLDASKNPKGIVVQSGAECLKERDAFAASTGFPTIKRDVLSFRKQKES